MLTHRPSPNYLVLGALAALVLAQAACGGDDSGDPDPDPPPTQSTLVPPSNSGFVEARTSQIVTNGAPPSTVFDDFTFADDGTIRTVRWQGIYCVQQDNAAAPSPTATSFTIAFYTDVGGRPNTAAPVQSSTYALSETDQTYEKTVGGLMCGTAANTTWPFYKYAVTLDAAFAAEAGTKYWVSIQATTPSYDVYFGWRDGTPLNNTSLQLFEGSYTTYNIDRAYALEP